MAGFAFGAYQADERYTVRDGINIARFVMKLKSIESGLTLSNQSDERFLMPGSVPAELGAAAGRDFAGAVAVGEDLAEV